MINKFHHRIFIFIILFTTINSFGLKDLVACNSSPCFCIQVNELGELTFVWDNSNFALPDFQEHQFFADTGNGFVQIGSENNFSVNSFTLSNLSLDVSSINFFMKSIYGINSSLISYSDTISSVYFNLVNQSNGDVLLTWNHPISIDSLPANSVYIIEKADVAIPISSSNWTTVTTVSKDSISFLDNVGVCSALVNYRVKLEINNCFFISNLDGGLIEDLQAPDAPLIQNVTNDTSSGNIIVNWDNSFAQDVSAYIVFKFSSGAWNSIDTIYGFQNTSFLDTNSSSFANNIVQYSIVAMDSCSSGTPPQNNTSSAGLEHQNILLNYQYDKCLSQVGLNWNHYINFKNSLKEYEIYFKNDSLTWTLLHTTSDTNYSYTIQEGNLNYQFFVKAIFNSSNLTSFSNILSFYANQPPIPEYSYISSVSVFGDTIRIIYLGENNIYINSLNIYRSSDQGLTFNQIYTENNPIFPFTYDDLSVSTSKKSYLYKISVVDSCNNEVSFSNLGSSILLEKEKKDFLNNELNWSSYNDWVNGVANYNVFFRINTNNNYSPLISLDSNNLSYSHDFTQLVEFPFDGKLCYKVTASELVNNFGVLGESISNELCIEHQPIVFVPNAINLSGINNKWKPSINLIDFSEYKVSIFNRLGQKICELNSVDEFWDGTVLNSKKYAPLGIYVYLIEFKNTRGQFFTKKGSITLLK